MKHVLRSFLTDVSAASDRYKAFAIFSPLPGDPPVWSLDWSSSQEVPQRLDCHLSSLPEAIEWPGEKGAVGVALASRWEPLAVVAWATSAGGGSLAELKETLQACHQLYWEESEKKWLHTLSCLLSGLKEQRREVGTAIHRGPAQALTAARLELSMLGDSASAGPLGQALAEASESLVQLVHGKLRSRHKDTDLSEAVRGELDFQARWRDVPGGQTTLTLPRCGMSTALSNLWLLTGGEVREGPEESTFVLRGTTL